jgi:hypothetical protein
LSLSDALYAALMSVTEKDGMFKLEGNHEFPVESNELDGNCLITRQAQKDLWSIIDGEMLRTRNSVVMLILGPAGSGKV